MYDHNYRNSSLAAEEIQVLKATLPTTSASPSQTGRKSKPDPRNENGSLPLEVISGSREFR